MHLGNMSAEQKRKLAEANYILHLGEGLLILRFLVAKRKKGERPGSDKHAGMLMKFTAVYKTECTLSSGNEEQGPFSKVGDGWELRKYQSRTQVRGSAALACTPTWITGQRSGGEKLNERSQA